MREQLFVLKRPMAVESRPARLFEIEGPHALSPARNLLPKLTSTSAVIHQAKYEKKLFDYHPVTQPSARATCPA